MSDQAADRIRAIQGHIEAARLTEAQIADPAFDFTACFASREWLRDHHVAVEDAVFELLAAIARLEDDLRLLRRAVTTDDPLDTNDPIVALACAHRQDSGDVDREVEKREAAEQQAQRQAAQICELSERWGTGAAVIEADGYYCCALTQRGCADELRAALASWDAP